MIELDADCTRRGGITCVRATVRNTRTTPQRVELESTLGGPVWPPEARPLTVPEWTGSTWVGVVPAGRTRGVGFATTAEPAADPVAIAGVERAGGRSPRGDHALVELDAASPPASVTSSDS